MSKIKAFIKKYKAEIIIVLGGVLTVLTQLSSAATSTKATLIIAFVTAAITLAYKWLKGATSADTAQELANLVEMLPDVMSLIVDSIKGNDDTTTTATTTAASKKKKIAKAQTELKVVSKMSREEILEKLLKNVQ